MEIEENSDLEHPFLIIIIILIFYVGESHFKPFSCPNKKETDFGVIPIINNFKNFVRAHFNNYHQFINDSKQKC